MSKFAVLFVCTAISSRRNKSHHLSSLDSALADTCHVKQRLYRIPLIRRTVNTEHSRGIRYYSTLLLWTRLLRHGIAWLNASQRRGSTEASQKAQKLSGKFNLATFYGCQHVLKTRADAIINTFLPAALLHSALFWLVSTRKHSNTITTSNEGPWCLNLFLPHGWHTRIRVNAVTHYL